VYAQHGIDCGDGTVIHYTGPLSGILRDYAQWNGEFWDQWIYAKLVGEERADT